MAKKRKPTPKEEEATSEDEEYLTENKTEDPSDDDDDDDEEDEEEGEEEEEENDDEDEGDAEDEEEAGEDEDEDEDEDEEDEEEDEVSKRESVRKLLQPFGKDQIIEILKEAALKNRSIIDRINQTVESDPVHRKIFVRGLGWDATTETLIPVFKKFGQIEDCNVVTDKLTGKSKGYGFVLFKTREGARKALKQPQKLIGNRMAACQLASLGPPTPNQPITDPTGRKIYVANVGPNVNPEKLRTFFAKFGEIEEGPLGYDRVTGKLRGFAIFIYKTADGCKKALEERTKLFEGYMLQCSRALEGFPGNKNQIVDPMMGSAVAAGMQPKNLGLTYAMGVNPGMVDQNLNPAASLMGQSSGIGVLNSATFGSSLNHSGLSPSVGSGFSPLVNRSGATPQLGLGVGFGAQPAINTISPSVIGSYDSQAALQGLGAYQSTQQGHFGAAARSQSGIGSFGTFPSYFGR